MTKSMSIDRMLNILQIVVLVAGFWYYGNERGKIDQQVVQNTKDVDKLDQRIDKLNDIVSDLARAQTAAATMESVGASERLAMKDQFMALSHRMDEWEKMGQGHTN